MKFTGVTKKINFTGLFGLLLLTVAVVNFFTSDNSDFVYKPWVMPMVAIAWALFGIAILSDIKPNDRNLVVALFDIGWVSCALVGVSSLAFVAQEEWIAPRIDFAQRQLNFDRNQLIRGAKEAVDAHFGIRCSDEDKACLAAKLLLAEVSRLPSDYDWRILSLYEKRSFDYGLPAQKELASSLEKLKVNHKKYEESLENLAKQRSKIDSLKAASWYKFGRFFAPLLIAVALGFRLSKCWFDIAKAYKSRVQVVEKA